MNASSIGSVAPAMGPLTGSVGVPGDKSISHRMALLAAVAEGRSLIKGYSHAGDCSATLDVVRKLGVGIERGPDSVTIDGVGWGGLQALRQQLDCQRSGTTMRLACGLLSGAFLELTLTGDEQLLRRPMERVAEPLRTMGAKIETTNGNPPIRIRGDLLQGIEYELPVASAQVKSAVLLAGLRAAGVTTVIEPIPTRDHTERLLAWLGAAIEVAEGPPRRITVRAGNVRAFEATVPGDVSSAAPLLAAAAAIPGSAITVDDVGVNPSRTAFLEVLARMGAEVQVEPLDDPGPEPVGRITLRHAGLRGVEIGEAEVPNLIDEVPLVAVLGALAEGTTVVRGAAELRVKESDRIAGVVTGLRALGADAEERPDGFTITGPSQLGGDSVDARGDHRLAMAFSVAALTADAPVAVDGLDSVADSFPGFIDTLKSLR
jgi:3-phosphoshikimate 1-carboxyvinyltransferase